MQHGSINVEHPRRVIRMEIEYDDGEVRRAVDDDAETIFRTLMDAFTLTMLRMGGHYEGPVMQVVRGANSSEA